MSSAPRPSVTLLSTLLALSGCDSFDFGRVTGTPAPAASVTGAPKAVPSSAASAEAPSQVVPGRLEIVLGGEIAFLPDPKPKGSGAAAADALASIRPILQDASATAASLTTPLDGRALGPMHVPAAEALLSARLGMLDVATVATTTPAALATGTLAALVRSGPAIAGAGATAAERGRGARVVTPSGAVGLVAFTRGSAEDAAALSSAIHGSRAACDVLVASLGGATPGAETPSAADTALAKVAVDAGADVVVLHGGKVPLGVAFVSGHPVFHGLGRLMGADDPKEPWSSRGFLARLSYEKKGAPPVVELCPYLLANGEPALLGGLSRTTQEGVFRRAIARLSEPLGPVSVGDPDAHSCFRVTPAEAPAAPSAAP